MTTQITMMDRDDYLALQRTEQLEAEGDSEILRLQKEITEARESIRISEKNLAVIQAALSRKQSDSA